MKLLFTGLSDQGCCRTANQDAYYTDPEGRFFIVADGMGGHAGGQEASRIATQSIQAYLAGFWASTLTSQDLLQAALLKANQEICRDQREHPERSGMGTTVVVVIFRDAQSWCAHVGDSRLYQLRGPQLQQITEDHTWVAQAVKDGQLLADQARMHPWRHVLSQCLGRPELQQIAIQPLEVYPGDRLLLCSDGLTEELTDSLIATYLESIPAGEQAVATLVNAAKEKGGRDNITVVIVTIAPLT
ncbi:MAG TPA: protein phosphatase 2C domain-containing protein [Candidatus Caenarcaniphilales bacterium]